MVAFHSPHRSEPVQSFATLYKVAPTSNRRGARYRDGDRKRERAPLFGNPPMHGVRDWGPHTNEMFGERIPALWRYLTRGLEDDEDTNQPRLHVDPVRSRDNVLLAGRLDLDPAWLVYNLEHQTAGTAKIRCDAPRLIHITAGVSREFFYPDGGDQLDYARLGAVSDGFDRYVHRLARNPENVILEVVHLDERTPHFHALVVPRDERNHLCTKSFFNGKADGERIQDLWYEELRHLPGIERGTCRSPYKHQDVHQLMEVMHAATPIVEDVVRSVLAPQPRPDGMDPATHQQREASRQQRELTEAFTPHLVKEAEQQRKLKYLGKFLHQQLEREHHGTDPGEIGPNLDLEGC